MVQPEPKKEKNWAAIGAVAGVIAIPVAIFTALLGGGGEADDDTEPTESSINAAPTSTGSPVTTTTTPTTTTTTSTPSPPPPPPTPVTGPDILRYEGPWWRAGFTGQMNNRTYSNILYVCGSPGDFAACDFVSATYGYVDLLVPGERSALTAFFGLSDRSSQDCHVEVDFILDGESWGETYTLTYGNFTDLEVPLEGVQQVRIEADFLQGVGCRAAFGNATWS